MQAIIPVTWDDVETQVDALLRRWDGHGIDSVYGIPTGGAPPAVMAACRAGLVLLNELPTTPTANVLVIDELVDTGRTFADYEGWNRDALFRKPHSPADVAPDALLMDGWLTFPWEKDDGRPTDAVVRLLSHLGEDPTREGLIDTPNRVVKSLVEMTSGYVSDPADILARTFDVDADEMVTVTGISFTSLCEHHMLPFTGTASVGYIPTGRVVGLSKIPRLVEMYARRLQVQERMTEQIAEAMVKHLDAAGVGVQVIGHHSCMSCRGVRQASAAMTTTAVRGMMKDDAGARSEFLAACRGMLN